MTIKIPSAFLFALALAACSDSGTDADQATGEEDTMESLSGSVLYRERMALPPGATVRVTLEDSARMDAPATVLATSTTPADGAPPYPFTLQYDESALVEQGRYGLRAKIEADGELLFTSTEFIPAFDEAREGPVEILVRRAGGGGAQEPAPAPSPLAETQWKVVEIGGAPAKPAGGENYPQINFSGDTVSGSTGVNNFTGSYERTDQSLTFGPLAATRKAAIDPELGQQEQAFLEALGRVASYSLSGTSLLLKDGDGNTLVLAESL